MATTQSSSPSLSPQEARQRIAIYARVSTLHNQNPEMQLTELREYASRRGWEVTAEYVDLGVSGSKGISPRAQPDARRRPCTGL
jgi:hypothetical protein